MYVDNVIKVIPNNIRSDISYYPFNYLHAGLICGISAYSCEGAGTMFTIRGAMKDRSKLPAVVKASFCLILIIFLMFNLSFYFVSVALIVAHKRHMETRESSRSRFSTMTKADHFTGSWGKCLL